jgi:hypothetical protein
MKITKQDLIDKLDHILWDDEVIEGKLNDGYPGRYTQQFGTVQYVCLLLPDFGIAKAGKSSLVSFLKERGFTSMRCGDYITMKDAYFIQKDLMIVLNVAYEIDENFIEDVEDDGSELSFSLNAEFSENTTLTFCPLEKNKESIKKFIEDFWDFEHLIHIKEDFRDFYMIAQNSQGLYKQRTKFKNITIKDGRYDLYYGENFPKDILFDFVKKDNGNLMILHGDPGSGKSNFIKNLITESIYDVIYIPPGMVSIISTPNFVPFMLQNKKSILLIEDAEEILSIERNSGTQNILGLTDGFLKDSLQIKVIATMNCDISKIDQALLRKGRLYYEHHFKALSKKEAKKLVDYLELDVTIDKDMTLAEIFNQEKNSEEDAFIARPIGFHAS